MTRVTLKNDDNENGYLTEEDGDAAWTPDQSKATVFNDDDEARATASRHILPGYDWDVESTDS